MVARASPRHSLPFKLSLAHHFGKTIPGLPVVPCIVICEDGKRPFTLMIRGAKYVHTNLIARDWRALAAFYQAVFGCETIPPERNFSGPVLEAGT